MSSPRLLIVDDDLDVQSVVVRSLEPLVRCDTAADLDAATELLEATHYDLLILDIELSGESGLDLMSALPTVAPGLPVLMLSASDDLDLVSQTATAGAVGYIVKPFRVNELRAHVTHALGTLHQDSRYRSWARRNLLGRMQQHGDGEQLGCVVIRVDEITVLQALYGTTAVAELRETIHKRLSTFSTELTVIGDLDETSIVATVPNPSKIRAQALARELRHHMSFTADAGSQTVDIRAAVGVSLANGSEPDELLRRAELAAAAARQRDSPGWAVHDHALSTRTEEQLKLVAELRASIGTESIQVHYQPVVDLETSRWKKVEALARWVRPSGPQLPTDAFIALAVETGVIEQLFDQVLNTACRDLAEHGPELGIDQVSVNLAASQLGNDLLLRQLDRALGRAGLDGSAVCLEVTESELLDSSPTMHQLLDDIAARGMSLSVDDFGTGYSSFMCLHQMPWSELKIDRSIIVAAEEQSGLEIIRAIVALGRALGVGIVAEGVETEAQAELTRDLGCGLGQGYLWSRPAPMKDLVALVRSRGLPQGA